MIYSKPFYQLVFSLTESIPTVRYRYGQSNPKVTRTQHILFMVIWHEAYGKGPVK